MNEILFRGHTRNFWVYSETIQFADIGNGVWWIFEDGKGHVSIHKPQQYTGLPDKNGEKIFIGDLVKFEGIDELYEVIINDFTQIPVVDSDRGQIELYKCHKEIEVITNIIEQSLGK